jgi:hypothetical protein
MKAVMHGLKIEIHQDFGLGFSLQVRVVLKVVLGQLRFQGGFVEWMQQQRMGKMHQDFGLGLQVEVVLRVVLGQLRLQGGFVEWSRGRERCSTV